MDGIDREGAATILGKKSHTVQDSYSLAHCARDAFGIKTFFYYGQQDKAYHKEHDKVISELTSTLKPEAV